MSNQHLVAVVGAGPAGIYGTRKLTEAGHRVVLINRDIKPGGLAEYGIFVDKEKMKTGLRKQFKRILADPKVFYLGHVTVGQDQPLSLKDLQDMGFGAVVVTAGAQGTKKLGIEGEEAVGVYHAKDVVYHYNSLPPFSEQHFRNRPARRDHRHGQRHGRYRQLAAQSEKDRRSGRGRAPRTAGKSLRRQRVRIYRHVSRQRRHETGDRTHQRGH